MNKLTKRVVNNLPLWHIDDYTTIITSAQKKKNIDRYVVITSKSIKKRWIFVILKKIRTSIYFSTFLFYTYPFSNTTVYILCY